ncbi:MAG: FtsW/RodA/SpoVE family cell cycle protein [Minisyncoccia bacterium]
MTGQNKYQKSLYLFTFILVVIGFLSLISASSIIGAEDYHNPYYFVKKQLLQGLLGGLILAWIVSKINYQSFKKLSLILLIINLGLVGLCFIGPFKNPSNGSFRWLKLGPLSFQPSELLKITYVLFLASILSSLNTEKRRQIFSSSFLIFLLSLGIVTGLLAKQPSTGTSIIIGLSSLVMYFIAGLSLKQILVVLLVGGLGLTFLVIKTPYRMQRFTSFLSGANDPLGSGYQSQQSLIGIGSGGIIGVGFGNSLQRFNYLPESHTDAIFSIIAEEFGFVGSIILLIIYLLFVSSGFKLAGTVSDLYGKYIIIGVISGIGFQAFINIASMCKLMPITGIPLPFISYGSSAMVANFLGLGLIHNIAKQN